MNECFSKKENTHEITIATCLSLTHCQPKYLLGKAALYMELPATISCNDSTTQPIRAPNNLKQTLTLQ